jgi:hypothetical protein
MNYPEIARTTLAGPANNQFYWDLFRLQTDLEMWYSYASQGLRNEIQGHSRKDQRLYQRKFCSALSRRNACIEANLELLL